MNVDNIIQLVKEYKDILAIATQLKNRELATNALRVLNALSELLAPSVKEEGSPKTDSAE